MRSGFRIVAISLMGLAFCVTAVPTFARPVEVNFQAEAPAGSIIVRTAERKLYLVLERGRALRYTVGVGRSGHQWVGKSAIAGKYIEPNWVPPAEVRREQPDLPTFVAGGSPANPMGHAALTLAGGSYAIHGTNAPESIGGFVSYGCIRMHNVDIADLFRRVTVGTPVIVTK